MSLEGFSFCWLLVVGGYKKESGKNMYKKKSEGWLKHSDFILLDMIFLQLAFILAYNLRFGLGNPYQSEEYLNLAIVYLLVDFVVAILFNSFKNVLKRGRYREFIAVIKHVMLVEGVTLFYLFSTQRGDIYSRISFYMMIPLYILFSYIGRLLWKRRFKKGRFYGGNKSLVIVAPKDTLSGCIENLRNENYNSYSFVGAVVMDADCKGQSIWDVPVVANYNELTDYVCREWVDEVFLSLDFPKEEETELIETVTHMGVAVHMAIARADHLAENRQRMERLGNYTVLTTSVRFATPAELALKRMMDIVGGFVGCVITLLLVIFIGPAIYISSPGPIFFSQERVGRNGKRFKMYKFRTMYLDAEERKADLIEQNRVGDGMMFKLDFDPRIIGNRTLPDGTTREGLGSFLRKTSLDEFPQFYNVLKGDMSLVGTRPPTLDEWSKYKPHHRARMSFRPGVTGLWQVSGRSNITDFEEVVKLDTEYIDEWSIGKDCRILAKTVKVVMGNVGAM
jgi:exopolysaccharide biosynthesis polyprenyl glycosylphosphotransferase